MEGTHYIRLLEPEEIGQGPGEDPEVVYYEHNLRAIRKDVGGQRQLRDDVLQEEFDAEFKIRIYPIFERLNTKWRIIDEYGTVFVPKKINREGGEGLPQYRVKRFILLCIAAEDEDPEIRERVTDANLQWGADTYIEWGHGTHIIWPQIMR